MRITQGTFSFLPDFTDEQIDAQIKYSLRHGWAMSIEYTDDPHPRNAYWELWGLPAFDTKEEDSENILREVRAAREAFPEHYIKVIAYDPTRGRQTTRARVHRQPAVGREALQPRPDPGPGPHATASGSSRSSAPPPTLVATAPPTNGARRRMSFEFGMRPPARRRVHRGAAAEPEEYDVDEDEADAGRSATTRRPPGARSRRRTSSRCSTSSTAS